jgi:protease-4
MIIAHPTAITGSIGVIMLNLNLEGLLMKKINRADPIFVETEDYLKTVLPRKTITEMNA